MKALKASGACRTEEHETTSGPADYALFLDGKPVAIVEAKKTAVDPANVLNQAERYGRGLTPSPYNFDGIRVPFLYSTNGEQIWFRDARNPESRRRRVADFHTPEALGELLARDFDGACRRLLQMPNAGERLRPYQRQADTATERAIAERKHALLLAMATGTGKTFTVVNEVYRLMKAGVAKRVLFLVDRRALVAQAVRAFASFDAEPGQKFNQVYEVYHGRFQREDFEEEEKFDANVLPKDFRGELVPTEAELARQEGRDYEPASVLLARIQAARAANDEKPTRRLRPSAATPAPAKSKPGRRESSV